MLTNNQNSPSCQFAEQIVSYLYGEFEGGEKFKFEAHLKDCSACADEYAGFGLVRSSVLEWRNEDFSKLETPTFATPAIEKIKLPPAVSTESGSWFGDFRKMFSFNPAWAMAALAILVVFAGITFYALNFSSSNEIAEKGSDKNAVKTAVSPTAEVSQKSDDKNNGDKDVENSVPPTSEIINPPARKESLKQSVPVKATLKVSNSEENKTDNVNRSPKANDPIKKTPPVKKRNVPNLNDFDDEEDETIRLADLFDELDTK